MVIRLNNKLSIITLGLSRPGVFLFSLIIFFICLIPKANAQNLVKNPSFEETNNWLNPFLYVYPDSFPGVKDWFTPLNNRAGVITSIPLENNIGNLNLVFPRTDSSHATIGIGSSWVSALAGISQPKTFVQTKLKTSLESFCSYSIGMYYFFRYKGVSSDPFYDTNHMSANRLGMHLSDQRIRDLSDTNASGNPQVFAFDDQNIIPQVAIPFTGGFYRDTTQYALVSDTIIAAGGEEYLTIGNFYPMYQTFAQSFRSNRVYIGTSSTIADFWNSVAFVDDVFVIPIPPPDSLLQTSQDSLICRGDSLTLQASSPNPAYQFLWDNGDTASSRVINQAGKYWVRLLCGCTKTLTDTFYIEEVPPLTWTTSLSDTMLCPGETLELPLDPELSYALNYSPFNESVLRLTNPGSYYLSWTNGCEEGNVAFRLDFHTYTEFPELDLDSTICEDPEITLPLEDFGESFQFYLDGKLVESPIYINDHGDYRLSLVQTCDSLDYEFSIDERGCIPDITIPNAFTPDNNGLNDYFSFDITGTVNEYDLRIYNRWGALVFQSAEATNFWDGRHKGAPVSGAFTYVLFVSVNGYGQKYSGIVNVVR